ncbi:MarR family winged helix-turn-helix transcriptional regulator [Pseudoroseicyclus sp. CXY001]|uniref:MarR family winged helix-turn-helix transcriptional regulator n=1 Tax=Pseudoroseicyclus sp. CXY001 TaxID=3242492 RepID=UPI00358DD245
MTQHRLSPFQEGVPELIAAHGLSAAAASSLLDLDLAMFQWSRRMQKGEWVAALLGQTGADLELTQFQALAAVARRCHAPGGGDQATVGDLAEMMQITPSRASRLAAELVARGYFRRAAAQEDGRKSCLELTQKAETFLASFRQHKWEFLLSIYESWPEEDIATFSRLFRRYTDGVAQKLAQG